MNRAFGVSAACAGLLVFALGLAGGAGATAGSPGALSQLGCLSDSGSSHDRNCGTANGIANAAFLAVSPDGKHVYVTGRDSDSVAVFARNKTTGGLTELPGMAGCISDAGSGHDPNCAVGQGLDRASGVVVSSDGRFVYVASNFGDSVAMFARDGATGALSEIGCIARANPACTAGTGLDGAFFLALSPDGRSLYVVSNVSNAIVVFARDPANGGLGELGCLTDTTDFDKACATRVAGLDGASGVAVSRDGRNVYVAAPRSSAITTFARDPGSGALGHLGCISGNGGYRKDKNCGKSGRGIEFAQFVVVSPDGKFVYVSATDTHTVAGFARDQGNGTLTQLGDEGCIGDIDYAATSCIPVRGLSLPLGLAFSPDGKNVYTGSFGYGTVASFKYDPATGGLRQFGACISSADGNCDRGIGLSRAGFVAVSPDGRHVYVNAPSSSAVSTFGRASAIVPVRLLTKAARVFKRRSVRLKVRCLPGASSGCLATLALSGRGKWKRIRLGPVDFELARGKRATVTLRGQGKALKLLRRARRFKAYVTVTTRDPAGNAFAYRRSIRVRR